MFYKDHLWLRVENKILRTEVKAVRPSSYRPGEIMLPNLPERDDDTNNGGEKSVLSLNHLESSFTVIRKTEGGTRLLGMF